MVTMAPTLAVSLVVTVRSLSWTAAVPLPSLAQLPPERVRGGAGALAMAVTAGAVHLVRRKKRGVS